VEFGERLCKEVLKSVPRRYFLYDGKLLSELRFCAWDSLEVFLLSPIQDTKLKHLDLWDVKPRPPPRSAKAQPTYTEHWMDYFDSQDAPSDNALLSLTFI
jgi:hypothetical protein